VSQGALAGTYSQTFTYAPNGLPTSYTDSAAGGLPAETVTTGYDSAGDPDALTGTSPYDYFDPYGNTIGSRPTAWPGQKGFVDGTTDPNASTGLADLGVREYQAATGSFISTDPILNTYDPKTSTRTRTPPLTLPPTLTPPAPQVAARRSMVRTAVGARPPESWPVKRTYSRRSGAAGTSCARAA
jgi:hypothetical protein